MYEHTQHNMSLRFIVGYCASVQFAIVTGVIPNSSHEYVDVSSSKLHVKHEHAAAVSGLARISETTGIPIQLCSSDELYFRIGCKLPLFGSYNTFGTIKPIDSNTYPDFGLVHNTFMLANHNPLLNWLYCLAGVAVFGIKKRVPPFPLLCGVYIGHNVLNRCLDQQNCMMAIPYATTSSLGATREYLQCSLMNSSEFGGGFDFISFLVYALAYNVNGDKRWFLSDKMPTSRLIEEIDGELDRRSSCTV